MNTTLTSALCLHLSRTICAKTPIFFHFHNESNGQLLTAATRNPIITLSNTVFNNVKNVAAWRFRRGICWGGCVVASHCRCHVDGADKASLMTLTDARVTVIQMLIGRLKCSDFRTMKMLGYIILCGCYWTTWWYGCLPWHRGIERSMMLSHFCVRVLAPNLWGGSIIEKF